MFNIEISPCFNFPFTAFMFSTWFTKANLAACCAAIFFFGLYLPYAIVYQYEQKMTDWMKGFSCLLSPVAFGLGTTYIARYEEQGIGIQWSNISERYGHYSNRRSMHNTVLK